MFGSGTWMSHSRDRPSTVWRFFSSWRRQQRVALSARVLGQVVLQLAEERALVAAEVLAVRRREVDRVLVRHVDPRDRDGAVVVHLLDELPRELDRLDVSPKRTAEDAL